MAEPMKIRATHQGEFTEVKVLLQHPMETGQRRDPKTGNNLPPHFIQTFSLAVNGKPMVQAQLNTSVAKNPVLIQLPEDSYRQFQTTWKLPKL